MHLDALPNNNPAELRAFDEVCERLGGFDPDISFEWVDGFLTALNAGPQLPSQEAWLAALCGDAFERAFGDPQAHAQALRALKARMAVLREQLDPEALMDDPAQMRLAPLMAEWTDEERQRLVDAQQLAPEEAQQLQTGVVWAEGFLDGVLRSEPLWPEPAEDDPDAGHYELMWAQLDALMLAPGSPELQEHLATFYPGETPTRDDLVTAALYAVQDLRVWWVDHAPRPETRRVEPQPGRNDPCPCGSGRKYKKCHGAAGA